jgi:hypothetical protein
MKKINPTPDSNQCVGDVSVSNQCVGDVSVSDMIRIRHQDTRLIRGVCVLNVSPIQETDDCTSFFLSPVLILPTNPIYSEKNLDKG